MNWLNWLLKRRLIQSPTGYGVRGYDAWGGGEYGARRSYGAHKGTDFKCVVGQIVTMPISGRVVREAKPYPDWFLSGVLIRSAEMEVKMFYFLPDDGVIGAYLKQGERVGVAQDIRLKYDNRMTPHIHVQIDSIDPALFI